jgi:hypothetical protein
LSVRDKSGRTQVYEGMNAACVLKGRVRMRDRVRVRVRVRDRVRG